MRKDVLRREKTGYDPGKEDVAMAMTATRPQRSAQELATIDRRLIVHPYLPSSTEERVVMVEGDGCRLRDADGREYLDATGGLWLDRKSTRLNSSHANISYAV